MANKNVFMARKNQHGTRPASKPNRHRAHASDKPKALVYPDWVKRISNHAERREAKNAFFAEWQRSRWA